MALNLSFSIACVLLLSLTFLSSADYNGEKSTPTPKPKPQQNESLLSSNVGIQGMVYCKSNQATKPVPLEGAVVRITCVAVDKLGYETEPFSFLSDATNEKGYFLATLCPSEVWANRKSVKECSAFLELSSMEDCDIPTNINKGISGALLSSHHILNDNDMKLYTVGPFFYTSEPKPVSNNDGY